jgi:hypothetical protein
MSLEENASDKKTGLMDQEITSCQWQQWLLTKERPSPDAKTSRWKLAKKQKKFLISSHLTLNIFVTYLYINLTV